MSTQHAMGLAAACLMLVGCGARSSHQPTANTLLEGAHVRLEQDDATQADLWLASAESRVHTEHQRKTFELLRAESDNRSGGADDVLPRIERLLREYPDDPRVHEVAGKTRLHLADFDQASRHFDIARQHYSNPADITRATDLLAVADGLNAYTHGRLALAQDGWARITDPTLRADVLKAYGFIAPEGPPHPDNVVVFSN